MKLFLRAESKGFERRTPLIPEHAGALVERGVEVVVESSAQRVYVDDAYRKVGCRITNENFESAAREYFILGLKDLSLATTNYSHRHIYYADLFERTSGRMLLTKFKEQGGVLYDYEYLLGPDRSVITNMSHWAGICGATVALSCLAKKTLPNYFINFSSLKNYLSTLILPALSVLIIGSGRVAKGVIEVLQSLKINYQIGDNIQHKYNLIFNCSALKTQTSPLLTLESVRQIEHKLLIMDIGIYLDSVFGNLFPLYSQVTTHQNPIIAITPNVELIAIDNLPSLLPKESSDNFSTLLFPHLLQLFLAPRLSISPWRIAEQRYQKEISCI